MKTLAYILLLCSFGASAQNIQINGSGSRVNINGSGTTIAINPYWRQMTVVDNGYYDGFPMISDVEGRDTWGIYKLSTTHASGSSLMLLHTTNFGQTWTEDSITVDEDVVHSTNHSFYRYPSGRMVIAYKPSGDSVIRFAYNDNNDSAFTSIATVINPTPNKPIFPCPIKMYPTSYGTLLFGYYVSGRNGETARSGVIMESSDSGLSFTEKCVIYTHNTSGDANPYTDWRGNEFGICETEPTGVEATSKFIAIIRTEVAAADASQYGMFFNSSDGGNTWTQVPGSDAATFINGDGQSISGNFYRGLFYQFLTTGSPYDIRLVGDSVLVVCGERNTSASYGYALRYVTAQKDSAFQNKVTNWVMHPVVKSYRAKTLGSAIDCGYPVLFWTGSNWFVGDYDISSQPNTIPGVVRRVSIQTIKIK